MTQYRRGARREYLIRNALLKRGWTEVYRSAGSHGVFDLIAVDVKAKRIHFVQVKSYILSNPERERLTQEMIPYDGEGWIVTHELAEKF